MGMDAKAVIFDLDGTLLDTLGDLRDSLEGALRDNGVLRSFDDGAFKLMVGNGITKLIERALPRGGMEEPAFAAKVREDFKARYAQNLTRRTKPYKGVPELVDRLKSEGFRLGVWSNKDEDNSAALIERFFPGAFDKVVGAAPDRPIKPEPQAGLELAAFLGAKPADLFYLGDSEVDMNSAKSCGFIAVGVGWGFREPEVLWTTGAQTVLDSPRDLFPFMEAFHGRVG
jgi:phosphoglycolate phosphatase